MYFKDIVPTGATIKAIAPSHGVYQNVVLTDKRYGLFPAAIAPVGQLVETGDSEKFILLEGASPVTYLPADRRNVDLTEYMSHVEHMHKLIEWKVNKISTAARSPVLDPEAFRKDDTIEITADQQYVKMVTQMPDFMWWLDHMQDYITRMAPPATVLVPEAIGLALLENGKIAYPRKRVKLKDSIFMDMLIPEAQLPMRIMRETAKWHWIVAACAKRVAKEIGTKYKLEDEDYLAFAAYTIGAYRGWNSSIDDNIRYTAEDVYQGILPYLGIPFSDLWPDLSWTTKILKDKNVLEIFEWIMMLNIMIGIAGVRVGTRVSPVQYVWRRGNVHIMKSVVRRYLQTPLDMGGTNDIWMHPAVNAHVQDGVLFPAIVREKGENEWRINTLERAETFVDLNIDRGEGDIPALETLNQNLRLVNSRDARTQQVKHREMTYLISSWRIQPEYDYGNKEVGAEEVLLSYISNPILKAKGAVWVSASWNRPRIDYTLGPVTTVTLPDIGKQRPVPGSIAPADMPPSQMSVQIVKEAHSQETANVLGVPLPPKTASEVGSASTPLEK